MLVAALARRLADIWAKPAGCGIVAPPTAVVAGPRPSVNPPLGYCTPYLSFYSRLYGGNMCNVKRSVTL